MTDLAVLHEWLKLGIFRVLYGCITICIQNFIEVVLHVARSMDTFIGQYQSVITML